MTSAKLKDKMDLSQWPDSIPNKTVKAIVKSLKNPVGSLHDAIIKVQENLRELGNTKQGLNDKIEIGGSDIYITYNNPNICDIGEDGIITINVILLYVSIMAEHIDQLESALVAQRGKK